MKLSGSGLGQMAGPCQHGNESSGIKNVVNFLTVW